MLLASPHSLPSEPDHPTTGVLVAVLDALPVCSFIIENEEIICNRAAERLTGYARQELPSLGRFFTALFGAGAEQARGTFDADRKSGFPAPRDFSITCKDGTPRIVELTCSGSARVICCMQDVTGYRRMELELVALSGKVASDSSEQKLLENEALLKAIVESVPFDFFALDRAGRYTMLSGATKNIWGDAVGKTVPEFAEGTALERYVPRWLDNNRRALAGETIRGECLYEWHGEKHVVQETIAPIRDAQQRILGSFGINLNVTQQQVTQKALRESEERYRRLSGLTSDYVHCCTRSGDEPYRVQWLGGAIEKITGYSEADVFDHGCWIELVHPEDRDRVASHLQELRPGQTYNDEYRIVCKDGEICWIREACRCEAGDEEGELRLYGASRNITERKHADIALRNIEEIFRLFMEYSPAYLAFKDENHRIVRLSRNFETLLGVPVDQLIGKTAADVYPPDLAEKIRRDDLKVLHEGRPTRMEEELNGRFYSSLKFSIPQNGESPLLVSIRTDITADKEAEDALCRLNEKLDRRVAERTAQLEAAILEQESFSYSVSHDLRAPLRHINSFSAILLEDYLESLPHQAREYLTRIRKATRRMGVLIDDLLELSRMSRTVIKRVPVNLSELAARTASMLRETEPDRVVDLVMVPDLYASCDKTLVRQLLENLLGNAWKYTVHTPAARIEFGATLSGSEVVFFVGDNGAGFDMNYKDKLFLPFQRLHGAEFEGNGIGLATAQRIVQRHGGVIWADAKEGEGARFFFTLP